MTEEPATTHGEPALAPARKAAAAGAAVADGVGRLSRIGMVGVRS